MFVFAEGGGSDPRVALDGELTGIGSGASLRIAIEGKPEERRPVSEATTASGGIAGILDSVRAAEEGGGGRIDAVGYRVVHPGAVIRDHARITDDLLEKLEAAAQFAPLHDPAAIAMIRETMRQLPAVPHFACFDTVFHQTMPTEASTYAIPKVYRDRGARRYGFHGLSCESVVRQMQGAGPLPQRMVIAHLGSGCSVTAVLDGESADTTMGLTPDGGVIMGTRPGDLDPGLIFYLLRQGAGDDAVSALEKIVNHEAGIVALTGLANDMKAVRKAAAEGNEAAVLGLKVFTRSVRKAIGGFAWLMGGLDAIVFTGGIGEHDPDTRSEVLSGSEAVLDASRNHATGTGVRRIDASDSRMAIFAVPAQEDLIIALHVTRLLQATA